MLIDQKEKLQKTAEMETNSSTESNNWYKSVEQNDIVKNNISGNKVNCKNIECFASAAELIRPTKKAKVEELSIIILGYIYDKHPEKSEKKQRFRVLFDSACSATLMNKQFVKH